MATKEVKAREAAGEDLSGIIWTAEKPYMLIRNTDKGMAASFFVSKDDFDFQIKKIKKNNEEVLYAAKIESFMKIDDYKSGFGRKDQISNNT